LVERFDADQATEKSQCVIGPRDRQPTDATQPQCLFSAWRSGKGRQFFQ
jgi:hypothetical protein